MLSALSAEAVEYLLVGAYALAAHGLPRATGDIDIWVRPTRENAVRVIRALRSFGAPLGDLTSDDLSRPGTVFQMGVPPQRIDVHTAINGVEFDEAWPGRLTARLGGIEVFVLGREELLRNKRAVGRARDLVDVQALTKAAPQSPRRGAPGKSRAPTGRRSKKK
jgi:hypothetical protein